MRSVAKSSQNSTNDASTSPQRFNIVYIVMVCVQSEVIEVYECRCGREFRKAPNLGQETIILPLRSPCEPPVTLTFTTTITSRQSTFCNPHDDKSM